MTLNQKRKNALADVDRIKIPRYAAEVKVFTRVGVHLTELGYCGMTEDALRAVVEKHVKTLLEQSEGQITVAELEHTLITLEKPLMRDLLQTLIDQRQQGAFPPSAPDGSSI